MTRQLMLICFLFFIHLPSFAATNIQPINHTIGNKQLLVDGTLLINMQSAPAGGLPNPKVMVMHAFDKIRRNTVNWGTTWTLVIPSGNYKIFLLPVSDGTILYVANTDFVTVPPGGTVSRSITYHSL